MEFKPGDVVKLKSSGPRMTVAWVGEVSPKICTCLWFENCTRIEGAFPAAALKLAGESDKGSVHVA